MLLAHFGRARMDRAGRGTLPQLRKVDADFDIADYKSASLPRNDGFNSRRGRTNAERHQRARVLPHHPPPLEHRTPPSRRRDSRQVERRRG